MISIMIIPFLFSIGSCKADLQLSGGHCCLLENCCVEASGGFPRCCCEQSCFTYYDCCLDILDIGCQPQMTQKSQVQNDAYCRTSRVHCNLDTT